MDDEVIDGDAVELPEGSTAHKIGSESVVRVPVSDPAASDQPTDNSTGKATDAGSSPAVDNDLHPLLKARAEEFARRYKTMTDTYDQALFSTMTDALEAIHQSTKAKPPRFPFATRLAFSFGETLMQAGQRLVILARPDALAPVSAEPLRAIGLPTVIVFAEDGGIDD